MEAARLEIVNNYNDHNKLLSFFASVWAQIIDPNISRPVKLHYNGPDLSIIQFSLQRCSTRCSPVVKCPTHKTLLLIHSNGCQARIGPRTC